MMLADDLPWPELGNVSRGATRGNQGQKGSIGPPDQDGRCLLQLRVQPGVLAVRLNRRSSEWYQLLDSEVTKALKLTKTYWRKARRRQDYNPRADQDHMELHEWLQQLKDKVMSQVELLIQKGEIQGPPYIMPDHIELSFLRKFIEREAASIPHNPRLRDIPPEEQYHLPADAFQESEDSESITLADTASASRSRQSFSPTLPRSVITSARPRPPTYAFPPGGSGTDIHARAESTSRELQRARETLSRAKGETQEALATYMTCLTAEQQAQERVTSLEEQRDDLLSQLLQSIPSSSSTSVQSSKDEGVQQSPNVLYREPAHAHGIVNSVERPIVDGASSNRLPSDPTQDPMAAGKKRKGKERVIQPPPSGYRPPSESLPMQASESDDSLPKSPRKRLDQRANSSTQSIPEVSRSPSFPSPPSNGSIEKHQYAI